MEKIVVAVLTKSKAVVHLAKSCPNEFGVLRSSFFFLLILHIRQNKDQVSTVRLHLRQIKSFRFIFNEPTLFSAAVILAACGNSRLGVNAA